MQTISFRDGSQHSMLGVDSYWERIHLAYRYEVEKRTKAHQRAIIASHTVFEPGEIAHINDNGTLLAAYYDFLEWQGLELHHREKLLRAKVHRNDYGRFCLVIERLGDGRYIVCYITSFNHTQDGEHIQSILGKLFAIAIDGTDGTPEFPPGTPSIKLVPPWRGHGFLYAMPVPRQNLKRHKHRQLRYILRIGELERVKQLIRLRVEMFRANHTRIRADELRWKKLFHESRVSRSNVQFIPDEVPDDAAAEVPDDAAAEPTALVTRAGDRRAIATGEPPVSGPTFAGQRNSTIPPHETSKAATSYPARPFTLPPNLGPYPLQRPRIHYLETNKHWLNVRWLLITMRLEIMHSSYYLNNIDIGRRVYRGSTCHCSVGADRPRLFIFCHEHKPATGGPL